MEDGAALGGGTYTGTHNFTGATVSFTTPTFSPPTLAAHAATKAYADGLAFAMDRSAYPDWIVPADDPIKKIGWEDGEEDN